MDGPLGGLWSWDWNWYARIAADGYPPHPSADYGFLPLWPATIRASEAIGAGPWGPWLLVLAATAALFVGVAAAHRRVDAAVDPCATAAAFACLPGTSLLLVAYPDALVAAAIAWSAALAARRPLLAIGLLALSAAARPVAVLGALAVAADRRAPGRGWRAALALVPAAVGAAVLAAFALRSGDWLAFTRAQAAWGRTGAGALPGLVAEAVAQGQVRFLLSLALAAGAALGAILLWRRGGAYRPWALLTAALVAVDLASGRPESLPRHLALAFPLAWIVALSLASRPRLRTPALVALAAVNLLLAAAIGVVAP